MDGKSNRDSWPGEYIRRPGSTSSRHSTRQLIRNMGAMIYSESEGISDGAIYLKSENPTILEDVKLVLNQCAKGDRVAIMNLAGDLNIDNKISDCAYRFLFLNAGLREIHLD